MFEARPTAPRFQTFVAALLWTASWAGLASAQSAAVPGDQWRPAGGTQYPASQTAATSTTDPTWRLPNGQTMTGGSQPADDPSNPLRQNRKPQPTAQAREPQQFNAPTNAAPLNASKSAAVSSAKPAVQARSTSAAVATKPAQVAKQAYVPPRGLPNRGPASIQHPSGQPAVWSMGYNAPQEKSTADDLWQTINVAFQGKPTSNQPAPKKRAAENLPMPGDFDVEMQDPVMHQPSGPDAFRQPVGGPYYRPYCEQGQCCDENGCPHGNCGDDVFEPGCGSPCGAPCDEPGCACEPGCGCPSGDCCKKDVFCIGPGDDESCHIVQIRWPKWQEVVVFGGVQGFKGPYDQTRDSGNFGFNEGFNIGAKIPYAQMGYQFGWRGAQSQLNGDKNTDIENQHFQEFVTAGLFHRSMEGLQFGVVWDMLNDERWKSQHFHQIRGELSIINGNCHEIGFDATVGLNLHTVDDGNDGEATFQASDQYVLFYRFHGCRGGEGRIYGGFNDDSDGIVGSDMLIPLGDRFCVQAGFTYLIPNEKPGLDGASHEAWNIGLGLVWHWDGQARKCFDNCYRPMFNVADNGILIVDERKKD